MGDEEAIRKAVELAKAGEVVAIFPEGTRRNKGVKKRVAQPRSAARVALLAGVPRAGGDRRNGEPDEARPASGRVRPADRPLGRLDTDDIRRSSKIATERLMEAIYELEATLSSFHPLGVEPPHEGRANVAQLCDGHWLVLAWTGKEPRPFCGQVVTPS